MPPRMITGVIKPQLAALNVCHMVASDSGVPFGYWRLYAWVMAMAMRATPIASPGKKPFKNSSETDCWAMTA